ncbi:dihydroxyacetone kinase subunit L [Erysipelotrichaceae bacterium MTC7]|nr:dihydroxyacetone kinase subunit L [Erysipelotrichaceae bacterium MTC7]
MEYVVNEKNAKITLQIIEAIHTNAAYLSEIDGATGDGDHGVNMDKGFMMAKERIQLSMNFSESLKVLGRTLVMDIGGSMGPIYGTMFSRLSRRFKKEERITKEVMVEALNSSIDGLMELAGAKIGDKTLLDTLYPATDAFTQAMNQQKSFKDCLIALSKGAEDGKESTKDMVAKIGRAARLGERSRGFLDAGATSCCIILQTMTSAMIEELDSE